MARFNPAVVAFAILCGLALPPLLRHSSARPGLVFGLTILFFAGFLAYAYWIGQRVRTVVAQPTEWTPLQHRFELRKVESQLRSLRAMRRQPAYVLLFLLFGVTVTGAAVFVLPHLPGTPGEHAILQAWGTLFGVAYIIWTALFAKIWLTGGWEPYIDGYIQKAESLRAQILALPH